jgi:hypothetical protein
MRVKQREEARRALLVESGVLLVAVAWCSWLASSLYRKSEADAKLDTHETLRLLPRMLQVFNAVAVAAIARALLAKRPTSKPIEELSRYVGTGRYA